MVVNQETSIPAGEFRLAVGPHRVKSALFRVKRRGAAFEFSGRGWGHGVGMCQWGARGMADEGMSWRDILGRYYPGAQLHEVR